MYNLELYNGYYYKMSSKVWLNNKIFELLILGYVN